jgi:hypothetical protein
MENSALKKILFTVGSLNQVTQMHAIASHLPDYDCYFSQFYSDHAIIKYLVKAGAANYSILSGQFRKNADRYLSDHHLKNDYAQSIYHHPYDLIVVCSDLLVPQSIKKRKTIWVQEGMTDPLRPWGKIVKALRLPPYFALGTALNGTSNQCDLYCVASEGYKDHFKSLGADPAKLVVTGIPNFDNVSALASTNFPHRNYVLVATSDIREVMGFENRLAFIRKCVGIAQGRPLIFKLHPNEKKERAVREIRENTPPDTVIYTAGAIDPMIFHCDELITQYSSAVYVGLALGKKVHSYFNVNELKKKTPLQNGGQSAAHIAELCRSYVEHNGPLRDFLQNHLPSFKEEYKKVA